jgi:hypothetical protein
MQTHAVHPLHAGGAVVVAAPDSDGAVLMAFDLGFDRHKGCRAMVLGPVELHSS